MNKTIKETLAMLIILSNLIIGVSGLAFCFEDMPIHAIITVVVFVVIQPLSWHYINKLSGYKDDKPTDKEITEAINKK